MHTAFRRVDVIGKGQQQLVIAVVVLHCNLGDAGLFFARKVNNLFVQRGFVAVEVLHKLADAAFITHDILPLFFAAVVGQGDFQPGVQKGLFAQAG